MDKLKQNIRTFSSVDFQDRSDLVGTFLSRTVKIFLNKNDDVFIIMGEWESCLQSISVNDYHFAKKSGGFCKGSMALAFLITLIHIRMPGKLKPACSVKRGKV